LKGLSKVGEKGRFVQAKKEKNSEVNIPIPRAYFFFAGAFFSSFLTGFLAIKLTSGYNLCGYLYL